MGVKKQLSPSSSRHNIFFGSIGLAGQNIYLWKPSKWQPAFDFSLSANRFDFSYENLSIIHLLWHSWQIFALLWMFLFYSYASFSFLRYFNYMLKYFEINRKTYILRQWLFLTSLPCRASPPFRSLWDVCLHNTTSSIKYHQHSL